jgi:NADPH-ferrihemoprotein reductase
MDYTTSFPWLQSRFPDLLATAQKSLNYDDVAVLSALAVGSTAYLLNGIAWNKPDPYEYMLYERPQEHLQGKRAQSATRNIFEKMENDVSQSITLVQLMANSRIHYKKKDIVIFWGSQSGTAEGFANRLARELPCRFGIQAMAADLSDFDPETIALIPHSKLAIFIISTYGEGDPSDNTTEFWNFLHHTSDFKLTNLRYFAFGLGNKNYKYYNRVIDVVTETLDKFGATSLLPLGRADESNGTTEEDFLQWKELVFSTLKRKLQLEEKPPVYEPTLNVVEDDSLTISDLHLGEPVESRSGKKTNVLCSPIRPLSIKESREIAASTDRNCIHMELDISQYPELKYKTGDHVAIWPMNPDDEVSRLLKILGLQRKSSIPISLLSCEPGTKVKLPTPTTVLAMFQYYLEICAPVSRETVQYLVQFAPTSSAKNILSTLGNDKEAYANLLLQKHINLGRLLEYSVADDGATWEHLPLSFIIESVPSMQPRYYSISSSSVVQPRRVALTVAVSDSLLKGEDATRSIPGLTTNYILALNGAMASKSADSRTLDRALTYPLQGPGDILKSGKVFAHIRKSRFKLPISSSTNLILIAAGTGIAPFRGFLHERARFKTMGRPVGQIMLFYGCRHPDEDYLYRDEFASLKQTLGDKLHIFTAFSRQDTSRKIYVQDRVNEQSQRLCDMFMDGQTYLYICGSTNMARAVTTQVGNSIKTSNNWTDDELRSWMDNQKKHGTWQEDVWG